MDAAEPRAGGAGNAANDLQPPSNAALIERFRDMGPDAWKVFLTATRMGLRPDIIEKAATRLRSLQTADKD